MHAVPAIPLRSMSPELFVGTVVSAFRKQIEVKFAQCWFPSSHDVSPILRAAGATALFQGPATSNSRNPAPCEPIDAHAKYGPGGSPARAPRNSVSPATDTFRHRASHEPETLEWHPVPGTQVPDEPS